MPKDPFGYDPSQPLFVQVAATAAHGPDEVMSLTYASADGARVPALFAVPKQTEVGCLMYQPGLVPKEAAAPIWPVAARLGLAVFTIDPRDTGARANGLRPLRNAFSSPEGLVSFLRSDVIDLRRGLDYLERQVACHHNVGYMGIRQGSNFGVLLAGADSRIRATILLSAGATWRATLFYAPAARRAVAQDPGAAAAAAAALAPLDPERWVRRIAPRPVMIVDGLADPLVPPVSALDLAAAAREPKVLVFYAGGEAPFAGSSDQRVVADVVAFLKRYLGQRPNGQ
ncbi:MAG TPA: alpha/beta hydrolase [Solirubrobacteraceae bacterium]|nr:alpha/beta hydrolase [Solirubrobacteraceae bacterium]